MKVTKKRADVLLVEKNIFPTRALAQANIIAGNVICEGNKITKSGQMISETSTFAIKEKLKYVSRGGYKLERALDDFNVMVRDFVCLDIGSSTGGFTDCLLQRGARKIYCIDSGTNQLNYSLRTNPKVEVFENTNARYLDERVVKETIDCCVMDVSFISVLKLLPAILTLLKDKSRIIILIKPQFEGSRDMLAKGGIVKDSNYHIVILETLMTEFEKLGLNCRGLVPSPILGRKGNREYLCLLTRDKEVQQHTFSIQDVVKSGEVVGEKPQERLKENKEI